MILLRTGISSIPPPKGQVTLSRLYRDRPAPAPRFLAPSSFVSRICTTFRVKLLRFIIYSITASGDSNKILARKTTVNSNKDRSGFQLGLYNPIYIIVKYICYIVIMKYVLVLPRPGCLWSRKLSARHYEIPEKHVQWTWSYVHFTSCTEIS